MHVGYDIKRVRAGRYVDLVRRARSIRVFDPRAVAVYEDVYVLYPVLRDRPRERYGVFGFYLQRDG